MSTKSNPNNRRKYPLWAAMERKGTKSYRDFVRHNMGGNETNLNVIINASPRREAAALRNLDKQVSPHRVNGRVVRALMRHFLFHGYGDLDSYIVY
jgi:hypothetical protein